MSQNHCFSKQVPQYLEVLVSLSEPLDTEILHPCNPGSSTSSLKNLLSAVEAVHGHLSEGLFH